MKNKKEYTPIMLSNYCVDCYYMRKEYVQAMFIVSGFSKCEKCLKVYLKVNGYENYNSRK